MAISFIGAGAQAVNSTAGGTPTAAWPSGYSVVAGDVAILIGAGRHNNGTSLAPSAPTGYTQAATSFSESGTYDLQVTVWYRVLQTGDTPPTLTVPTAYGGNSGGLSAQVAIYRGVDNTTVEDVAETTASSTASTTWQPSGALTTATDNAWVLSVVASADDNALSVSSGFTARMSGAAYDTTLGGDHAVGLADKEQATAGSVTNPTWTQTLVASDAWAGITLALRAAPATVTRTATGSGSGGQSVVDVLTAIRTAAGSGAGSETGAGGVLRTATASGSGAGDNNAVLTLAGVSNTGVRSPDSALFDPTGDFSLLIRLAADDWTPAAIDDVLTKWNTNLGNRSWRFAINTLGNIRFSVSESGAAETVVVSTANMSTFTAGQLYWLKVDVDVDNGASGFTVSFSWADDSPQVPTAWNALGTPVANSTLGTLSLFQGTAQLWIGNNGNVTAPFAGKIARAIGYDTTGTMFDWNPTVPSDTFTDIRGSVFTVQGTGNSWANAAAPSSYANDVVTKLRTATGSGAGTESATGTVTAGSVDRTASGSGTGTQTATGLATKARTATGSGSSGFDAFPLVIRFRTATGSGTGTATAAVKRTIAVTASGFGSGTAAVLVARVLYRSASAAGASSQQAWAERIFDLQVPLAPRQFRKRFFPPPSKPVSRGKPLQPPRARW